MSGITFDVIQYDVVVEFPDVDAEVVLVAGPQGAQGPAGPPGSSTGVAFEWVQSSPSSSWSVTHDLGRYPYSSEVTIDGEVVFPDVSYPSSSSVSVVFASPASGILRLT